MAILLPAQIYTLEPNVGKSFYENLAGGANASVTVNNLSEDGPVNLVLTRVNAPVITYVIPPLSSLTLTVERLLVAGLLTDGLPSFGEIQIVTETLQEIERV